MTRGRICCLVPRSLQVGSLVLRVLSHNCRCQFILFVNRSMPLVLYNGSPSYYLFFLGRLIGCGQGRVFTFREVFQSALFGRCQRTFCRLFRGSTNRTPRVRKCQDLSQRAYPNFSVILYMNYSTIAFLGIYSLVSVYGVSVFVYLASASKGMTIIYRNVLGAMTCRRVLNECNILLNLSRRVVHRLGNVNSVVVVYVSRRGQSISLSNATWCHVSNSP